MTTFDFDLDPLTWQRTGWGHGHPFTQDVTRAFEDEVKVLMQSQREADLITGPCTVSLSFFFATKDKKKWGTPKTTRGDIDNLLKGIFDAGNGITWQDDALIWRLTDVRKVWAERGHIHLEVSVDE